MLHLVWYGLLAILLATGIFALAARFLPAGEQIAPPLRDEPPWELPPDRSLQPDEIDGVRLPVALRGYRFAETDLLLDRLAAELRVRDAEIAQLRGEAPAVALAPAGTAPPYVDDPSVDDTPGYEPLPFDAPFGPPPVLPLGDEDVAADSDEDVEPPAEHPEPLLDLTDHSGPALPAPETFNFGPSADEVGEDELDDELAVAQQMSDELAFPEPGVDGLAETVPIAEPVPFDALFGPLALLPPEVGDAGPDGEVAVDGDHIANAPPAEQSEPLLDLTDTSAPAVTAAQPPSEGGAAPDLPEELAVAQQMSDELAFPEPGVDGSADSVPGSKSVPFDALFGPLPVPPPEVGDEDTEPGGEVAIDGDPVADAPPAEHSEELNGTSTPTPTAAQPPSEDGAAPDMPEELAVAQQPAEEQPAEEQPAEEQAAPEQPAPEQPQPFNPPVYAPPISAAHLPFAPPHRIQPEQYAPPPIVHPVYVPPGGNGPAAAPAAASGNPAAGGLPAAPPTWSLTAPPWAVSPMPPVALHVAPPPTPPVQPGAAGDRRIAPVGRPGPDAGGPEPGQQQQRRAADPQRPAPQAAQAECVALTSRAASGPRRHRSTSPITTTSGDVPCTAKRRCSNG